MFKKFLITNNIKNNYHLRFRVDLLNGYSFLSDLDDDKFYYNENTKTGIFLFGYILPRIDQNESIINLENLLVEFNKNPLSILNKIKGIFTIVHLNNGMLKIYNDHLGISKFFYSSKDNNLIVSNSVELVIKNIKSPELCKKSISEYYLFNYLLNKNTFYKDISYSSPASHLYLNQNNIKVDYYFDIIKVIQNQDKIIKNTSASEYISEVWLKIISQYLKYQNNEVSMTLTAGMDSRIILGTLLKFGDGNINSFTFGHSDSYDVKHAKLIASKTGINHNHYYPEESFFNDFNPKAQKTFNLGESIVSIYRTHRLDAYSKVSKSFNGIIMGLGGSDLIRGIDYDNLIVSKIAFHLWNNNSLESFFNQPDNLKRYNGIINIDKDEILDNKFKYSYLKNPLEYLFKVIIPLHFSQDIILNQNLGINTYIPFLDIDYLYHLSKTTYLQIEEIRNYKYYDIKKRFVGLKFSAKFLNNLNNELSEFSLGKGYTPNDIIRNLPATILKNYLYKIRNRNTYQIANFSFSEWYWNYLNKYLQENNFDNIINKKNLLTQLNSVPKSGGEYHFLDYTKAVNIHMASLLIN